jgi:enoyl-CoA hydratase/carnithine racemase
MGSSPRVRVEIDGVIGVITLDRPEVRNALDLASGEELDRALSDVEGDPVVRAIVLAGEGPVFCASADLRALAAGAFELVLARDLVVATPKATFGVPEVRWGPLAAAGGAIRLPHRIPPNIANELLLTAEPIDAARAAALGLVNRLVAPGDAVQAAKELALEVAANAPLGIEATMRVAELTIAEGETAAWTLALELLDRLRSTQDTAEGLAAFAERRRPNWRRC